MQNNKIRFLAVVQCQCQCQKPDSLGFPAFVVALCRILIAKLQKTAATKRLAKCTETDIGDWCGEPGGQTFDIDTDINQSNAGVFWLRCQRFRVLLVCASDRVNVYVVLYEFQHFAFKLFTVLFVLTCLVVFICKKRLDKRFRLVYVLRRSSAKSSILSQLQFHGELIQDLKCPNSRDKLRKNVIKIEKLCANENPDELFVILRKWGIKMSFRTKALLTKKCE